MMSILFGMLGGPVLALTLTILGLGLFLPTAQVIPARAQSRT
jgi:hypothetical protein